MDEKMDYNLDNLAKLSKIKLNDDEKKEFSEHIKNMIGFMDNLSNIDTSGVDKAKVQESKAYLREDVANKDNISSEIIKNAPLSDNDGSVLISKIL